MEVVYTKEPQICESCGQSSDYNLVNGNPICLCCGQSMIKDAGKNPVEGSLDSLNGIITAVDVEKSILKTLIIAPEVLPPLTLDEMRSNTAKAQKAFETLEARLNKLRQQKMQAVADNQSKTVVELTKQDTEICAKVDSAYEFWQNAKKNYEYALIGRESQIIAENLLSEYSVKVDIRAAKGNEMLNSLRQLSGLIGRVSELAGEFQGLQLIGLNEMEKLVREFRRLNIYRVGDAEIPIIKGDNYGLIREVRQSLSKEATLLENNLSVIENAINTLRKSCDFNLLQQG
ncbi:MAG: hypothetical protein AAB906_01990 [Patescibacteria group bacterium]